MVRYIQKDQPTANLFISLQLQGDTLNRHGYGAKVFLYQDGRTQFQEQNPVRGYFSSVDQQLIFGLGTKPIIDSLLIVWPDDKRQLLSKVNADTSMILSWENAEVDASAPNNQD